jgi:sigma-B regulation protein RsbU (phosphoserine phosphatase)
MFAEPVVTEPRRRGGTTLLTWRVTTRQALTLPVVPPFLLALHRSLQACEFDEDAVATTLHEAISNAAIHGNLGLTAPAGAGLGAADALWRGIEARLRDAAMAAKPLVITAARQNKLLVIAVRDIGAGFAAGDISRAKSSASHGRGVQLMRAMSRSLEYRLEGREAVLTFDLHDTNAAAPQIGHDQADSFDILASRILIADDSETQREIISHCLRTAGFSDIVHAADGHEALRQFEKFEPDLVLLDLAMPGIDGIETCRTMQSRNTESVPILIQSVTLQPEARVRAFDAGAVDFIVKPFYAPELIARVRMHLDRGCLMHKLHQFRARLTDELNAAKLMQESLIPSRGLLETMRNTMTLDVAAHSEMSSELGGDIWGLRKIDEHRVAVFIADFTGHGVASAANAFRLHAVFSESGIRFERPDLVMQALNVRLFGAVPVGNFATLFYGVLDLKRDRLDYAAAGAPAPVLIMPDGALLEVDANGVPVGVKPWQDYEVRTLPFPPGTSLFMYSDALLESCDGDGKSWDYDELLRRMHGSGGQPSADRIADILAAFDVGRARPLPDDLTLVYLRRVIESASYSQSY